MSIGGGGKPGGIGEKLGQLPIAKQANRAFGYFGDAMRYSWANAELKNQLVKRSLDEIRASGDLERIADGVNTMTGWSKTKTFGSVGDFVTFAPRWFQSRLNTIYKAAKGLRPNATLDQAMARNSLLRLIGAGTLLTYAVNTSLGNETDTRMIVDGKRNPHFMRINYEGHYYNLFGPWDSLLGMFINVGTGKTPTAIRSMASGSVAMAWDLITGKDYNYKPTHDNPADFAVWLGKSFVPFSWNQIPADVGNIYQGAKEGDTKKVIGNTVNIVGQVAGVKDYPISPVMDLQYKWAPDFKQYNAIPTNPIEVKASHGVTRDKYRERNPDVDAKLFITGQVNTVATVTAANKVLRMITENKINPDDINGVKSNRADRDKTMQLGMRYSGNTPTDRLVRLLDQRAATNP